MPENERPKSAYELAMERLKKKDADSGEAQAPLTEIQKADIAEARSVHAAKTAELGILHRSKIAAIFEPEARELLEGEHRDELRRLNEELERKIDRIRRAR